MSLAATAFNPVLAPGASYTVPAGKTAIFSMRNVYTESDPGSDATVLINGNVVIVFDTNFVQGEYKPFACNTGDVITNYSRSLNSVSLSGLLY
jgi:hypothetical protein